MADAPDNIVLEHLRHIRGAIDELREDMREVKHRLTAVERQIASLTATESDHYASVAVRLDRVERRIERIEHRLDLVPSG